MMLSKLLLYASILILFLCQAGFAEPYAPMAKLNAQGLKMQKLSGETEADRLQRVPSREEVDVPLYPGAVIISQVIGKSGEMLPGINLASTDPPEKVRAWYREKLKGWSWSDMFNFFYQGKGKLNPAQMMSTPTVNVMEIAKESLDMRLVDVPGAKTRIQMTFRPKSK